MRKVSVIAITATYLDMTFAITANITSVVETGDYFVRTVICTIIWASFPMSHVDDMRGDRMDDLISRQDAIDEAYEIIIDGQKLKVVQVETLIGLPSAEPKTGRDCTDFVRWLMDEVMDEENWQMNAVANGEIICRKLKKLGMLDVVDGYYIKTQETGDMRGD